METNLVVQWGVLILRRRSILAILIMLVATRAIAAEHNIELASLEKDRSLTVIKAYTPPRVSEHYEYYEITGNSAVELRGQMSKNGPTWEDGKTYDSVTSWRWTLDFGPDRAFQACSATSFQVSMDIKFLFPKWSRTGEEPQLLVEMWQTYLKNITAHERGHRDLAVDAAYEFSRTVSRWPRDLSCGEFERRARDLGRELMEKLNAEELAYDADTNHGSTQGAYFP